MKYGKGESYFIFIHEKICSLQIPMDYIILVQVIHSFRNIYCCFK